MHLGDRVEAAEHATWRPRHSLAMLRREWLTAQVARGTESQADSLSNELRKLFQRTTG